MKLTDARLNVDRETGAWSASPNQPAAPYIRFERQALQPGDTYAVVRPDGCTTGARAAFPAGQTHQVIAILHRADGSELGAPHYGADGVPVDNLPGYDLTL
jgi:hypothetical protein